MSALHWDITHLRQHLQYAIQLEYWTVPFYMCAMYSIKDPTSDAFKLLQSIAHQEMLHMQLACNVANAFDTEIDEVQVFATPAYVGTQVPHLQFTDGELNRDPFDPSLSYRPYSAELGPLDEPRINAMCLIEYPEIDSGEPPQLKENVSEYSSIGQFYQAVLFGAGQLADQIRGNFNQVDHFSRFYQGFPDQTITLDARPGYAQVTRLLNAITDQGEGVRRSDEVPPDYRNTADGFNNSQDHFDKFNLIKSLTQRPECYSGVANPPPGSEGARAQQILIEQFKRFRADLVSEFNGHHSPNFGPNMASLGGAFLNCWKNGALPRLA
jgi:hypothetical protein